MVFAHKRAVVFAYQAAGVVHAFVLDRQGTVVLWCAAVKCYGCCCACVAGEAAVDVKADLRGGTIRTNRAASDVAAFVLADKTAGVVAALVADVYIKIAMRYDFSDAGYICAAAYGRTDVAASAAAADIANVACRAVAVGIDRAVVFTYQAAGVVHAFVLHRQAVVTDILWGLVLEACCWGVDDGCGVADAARHLCFDGTTGRAAHNVGIFIPAYQTARVVAALVADADVYLAARKNFAYADDVDAAVDRRTHVACCAATSNIAHVVTWCAGVVFGCHGIGHKGADVFADKAAGVVTALVADVHAVVVLW